MEWILDFYFDLAINTTHVEDHGLSLKEIYQFFEQENYLEYNRKDGSFEAVGIIGSKEIKVIYRKKMNTKKKKHLFIITAFPYILSELEHINLEGYNHEN
ncbi:hypothetical protein [Leptospira bandrabouensis]|uniref:Uncharacterized protein n=1 Tax=Leptospira bandrabouensis TaxID=2484903 RepID=A0A6H3NQ72_9LEPT|nr:hypothetical protein [Leptospira bandrabouensis]TGN07438.1 hypothetical protein EHR07_04770 [Leptospira bandrabouensis]TGN12817.1 hypothetical protein EHR08_15835 [Leptospira bandrabouensis]